MSSATEQYLESKIASNEAVDVPLLVDYLIQDSLQRGASDIHIEPWEDMVGVRVRVNGVLQWLVGIPNEHQPNIAGRFKVMANWKVIPLDCRKTGRQPQKILVGCSFAFRFFRRFTVKKLFVVFLIRTQKHSILAVWVLMMKRLRNSRS